MSSKGKSSATTVGGTTSAPKLRFPEFRNASGWDNKPLSEVLSPVVRERSKPSKPYTGLGLRSHGKGTFLKEEEDPAKNAMDVLFEVKRDDLIVNITFAWEGAIAIAGLSDDGALVSHRFPTYAFKKGKALPEFFRYRIIEKQFVYNLGVISPGGAGRNRVMSKTDFLKLKVLLPDIAEQQKVADCLDSADALIAAQVRKVEVLRTYKKGLMQQLFPQEGETQPRLRFPEFEGAGEWEEVAVSRVAKITTGSRDTQNKVEDGEFPFFVRSQTVERIDSFAFDCEAVLTSGDGVGVGKNFHYIDGKFDFHQRVYCIYDFKKRLRGKFFFYFFSEFFGSRVMKMSAKNSVDSVRMAMIAEMPILLPSPQEQERIANCLTSIDDLIAAETRKLDLLKTHKKGLMQQLFPYVGEADE